MTLMLNKGQNQNRRKFHILQLTERTEEEWQPSLQLLKQTNRHNKHPFNSSEYNKAQIRDI